MNTKKERQLILSCLDIAAQRGAQKCRVTYTWSKEENIAILNGEIDKITGCDDKSLSFALFVNGRFGCFSTNKTDLDAIGDFIGKAIEMVKELAPDEYRRLPEKSRCCKTALAGDELGLFDESYLGLKTADKIRIARELAIYGQETPFKLISEEGEYSDSISVTLIADSEGLDCRHIETSFDYGVEITIEDSEGDKYSAYDWTSATSMNKFDASRCGRNAYGRAAAQIGSEAIESGKYNMVVSNEVSYKFISPIINALNGYSIQQHQSFLEDSLGKTVFPKGLSIVERPFIKGEGGSKLFDDEGVALAEKDIVKNGTVRQYYLNSYMSGKLGMPGTSEDATRPCVEPWPEKGLNCDDIIKMCSDGILVTGFNGGNINNATGDFSYGVEGFLFTNGKITKPISEMLVTGNILKLWSSFIAAGSDARRCCIKLVPTLAFKEVDFNGIN